ncbi:MAG: outer membrane protein assembly factor BamC [Deltaproteobacteria bacterium]|jgi:hypothetical protein|nr:outer membrane protein assembly factor BamC [Deltaproteobacteria bacterium]MCK5010283.1 outer membrane protein assembly factor BamC [Deltaproteobacteria bacterium]MCK5186105.1 outer membrane protein assembly factor BamC [Deltaproteobacteria bacterium]MCK5514859.1 outer membrane protein assembly factor BamC [Deltaproteobacteria bacterium]NOQ86416.1 outer membrane protein assembly factor BamC [Deltaproteobacteria bacterium]
MKPPIVLKIWLLLLLLQFGCAPQNVEEENIYYVAKIFNEEYDEVWDTLLHIMFEELMYPIRKKDKEKGIIQTDWISVLRLRGTLRWYVRVLLDRRDNKTLVKIYDRVEEPAEVSGKFKNKKGEVKTGWKISQEEIADANKILKMLSTRLE